MADVRFLGSVNLTIEVGAAPLVGEVNLDLEESLAPVYASADFALTLTLTAAPELALLLQDGTAQGDDFLLARLSGAIEDGTAQGDQLLESVSDLAFSDGTAQGDEVASVGANVVAPLEDGTAQGDQWGTLPVRVVADGAAQGDEFLPSRTVTVEDGTAQGDQVYAVAQATRYAAEDGTAQGDEWSLIGLRVVFLEDGTAQGDAAQAVTASGEAGRAVFVVNADTAAVSRYRFDEPINGATLAEDGLRLSASTGLYALDAESDEGVAVAWTLDTGFSRLGSEYLKRLSYIDLLGRYSDQPVLRVVSSRVGVKRQDSYTMSGITRDVYRDGRVKVGRGIQSVFYGLGVTGSGPAEIESVVVEATPLSRRR